MTRAGLLLPLVLPSCITAGLWTDAVTPDVETVWSGCELPADGLHVPLRPETEPLAIPVRRAPELPPGLRPLLRGTTGCFVLFPIFPPDPAATVAAGVFSGLPGFEVDTAAAELVWHHGEDMVADLDLGGPLFLDRVVREVGEEPASTPCEPGPGLTAALGHVFDPEGPWRPLLAGGSWQYSDATRIWTGAVGTTTPFLRRDLVYPDDEEWQRLWGRVVTVELVGGDTTRRLALRSEFLWMARHLEPAADGSRWSTRGRWGADVLDVPPVDVVYAHHLRPPTSVTYRESEERTESIVGDAALALGLTPFTLLADAALAVFYALTD